MALDLDSYRRSAERFSEQIDREYYLHLSGRKREFEIEPIYERHADLFSAGAVEALRSTAQRAPGERARQVRHLLAFAFEGHVGQATMREAAELAELEASLQVRVDSTEIPYRAVPVALANEPDSGRRSAIEAARDELLTARLNPIHLVSLQRAHDLARELGWPSYRAACADLRGIDLEAVAAQARRFVRATDAAYPELVNPQLASAALPPLGEVTRSDLPRFFRAPGVDALFPAERLVPAFAETLAGMGIDLGAQGNVHLDTESRPSKSSRAFCATPRVPGEIHLVIAPSGGRDDYESLFHEGGHVEHYAHVDPALAFEHRHLGDNSVTESFAFLFQHLTEDPEWLRARLGVAEPEPVLGYARALKLVMLRRYAAKIAYELELHDAGVDLEAMPSRYAELLGADTRVAWPQASWLADVDAGFYVACYLRAWALETTWRRALQERFGGRWFEAEAAGAWLRELWSQGQRLGGGELLAETLGEELDLGVLTAEFVDVPGGQADSLRAMESSQTRSRRERLTNDLQKALEDLRQAGEDASGDVRSGIESAVSRIRDASGVASPGDLRSQLDSFRDWLQSATADLLDEIEKEVRKRREQLEGDGGKRGAARSGTTKSGTTKSGTTKSSGGSGSSKSSSS